MYILTVEYCIHAGKLSDNPSDNSFQQMQERASGGRGASKAGGLSADIRPCCVTRKLSDSRQTTVFCICRKERVAAEGSRKRGAFPPTQDDSARHESCQTAVRQPSDDSQTALGSPSTGKSPDKGQNAVDGSSVSRGRSNDLDTRLQQMPQRSKPSVVQRAKSFVQVSHSSFSGTTFDLTSNTGA